MSPASMITIWRFSLVRTLCTGWMLVIWYLPARQDLPMCDWMSLWMSASGGALKVTCEGASNDLALNESLDECFRPAKVSRSRLSADTTAMASSLQAGDFFPAAKSESMKLPMLD